MRSIVIDANLLILLVVGSTDRSLIGIHKRTRQFQQEDFDLLLSVLATFSEILVTPNVLTETSNLASQIADPQKSAVLGQLASLIQAHREQHVPSAGVTENREFLRLGLTDCALLDLVGSETTLITADLDLYLAASRVNQQAINFTHLQQARLLS